MQSSDEPSSGCAPPSLHQTLRAATSETHERLHLHEGFAAIRSGTIDLVDYRALLFRLYGFHVSFEAALGLASDRSAWLQDDLAALTMGGNTPEMIPRCTSLEAFATPTRQLGALYVVEGSTLGGRQLARDLAPLLAPLLGSAGGAGRRFFLGRGAQTNAAWKTFLARLTLSGSTPAVRSEIVAAAVRTFSIFEEWLRGWRSFTG